MNIKITEKVLSFPPYISTSWDNVASLRMEHSVLVITLTDGYRVHIPNLDEQICRAIFSSHLRFMELKSELKTMSIPLPLGPMGLGLEGLGSALQHNPDQSNLPPLPQEVLGRISGVSRALSTEELACLPKPQPGCNCMYCQITRAMHPAVEAEVVEELVSDEDLKFRLWDVEPSGEKLYTVRNPAESYEQYTVFLGDPIGCTCGQKNCEHVRAVLNS